MSENDERLPIIPHESVAVVDCCGCLVVERKGANATILCSECGAVIRTVPLEAVERTMQVMALVHTICSARCTHCGALNTFPGFASIEAFICSECDEAVSLSHSVE